MFIYLLLHGMRMQVDNGGCCKHLCGFIFHERSAPRKLGKNGCTHSVTKLVKLG
jgi:hypothetical protein